jgi:hypothetical protein
MKVGIVDMLQNCHQCRQSRYNKCDDDGVDDVLQIK